VNKHNIIISFRDTGALLPGAGGNFVSALSGKFGLCARSPCHSTSVHCASTDCNGDTQSPLAASDRRKGSAKQGGALRTLESLKLKKIIMVAVGSGVNFVADLVSILWRETSVNSNANYLLVRYKKMCALIRFLKMRQGKSVALSTSSWNASAVHSLYSN
jgi:hypothetical protein